MQNMIANVCILFFKIVVYIKCTFKFFLVVEFLTGRWSVGRWSQHLIGGRLVDDRWLMDGWLIGMWLVVSSQLVRGFKKTWFARTHWIKYFHESSVKSLRLLWQSECRACKLLPCFLIVVGFFSITSTYHHFPLENHLS